MLFPLLGFLSFSISFIIELGGGVIEGVGEVGRGQLVVPIARDTIVSLLYFYFFMFNILVLICKDTTFF